MNDIEIEILSKEIKKDLAMSLYKLHFKSLPNDVLPNFGMDLEYRYFKSLLVNKGKLVIAKNNCNKILGFIALRSNYQNFISILDIKSISVFLLNSICKPSLLIKLIKQLSNKTKQLKLSAEIDYFAVDENFRSKGIGGLLILKAEEISEIDGLCYLCTKTSNDRLFRYYQKIKSAEIIKEFEILDKKYRYLFWKIKK